MPLLISKQSIDQRIAEAGKAAMPQATLDAADFWTIRPDEPADFAANYPAAPARRNAPPVAPDEPTR